MLSRYPNTIVHAVASNENRAEFARRSIYANESQANSNNGIEQSDGKYRLEKGFLGAHSDIGGGYKSGDLSNVALMWMIKQAQEKGNIKLNEAMIASKQYNQINNPIVHDSSWSIPFSLGGEFRWATDNSKDYEKTKIFNNFEHLGLNWNDTKMFQNPNHKQFDKVENITKLYLKSSDSQYAIYPAMLANPWTYAQHYRYVKLKDELKDGKLKEGGLKDMLGAGSILMAANDPNKVIQIGDYIDWLNCNYGLNLENNSKYDSSTGYSHPDMDVCFNSAIKYSFLGK